MKVLLTGSFGKIGYRVVEALLDRGHAVTCFDLDTPANRRTARDFSGRIALRWGDVTDAQAVREAVAGQEVVIHNAAIIPPGSDRLPALAERVNVGGTRNIVDAIEQSPLRPLLIFPSSVSIHGHRRPDAPGLLRIDAPLQAEDIYAQHKIACEALIEASSVRWVILRLGASLEARNGASLEDARGLLKLTLSRSPQVRIEFIHTKDVATAFANAIEVPDVVGRKFFLGGGSRCQTRWAAFNSMFLEAMGCGVLPEEAFGSEPYYTDWMDTEESQRLLRYQQHSLDDHRSELEARFRWIRPLGFAIGPLLRSVLLSQSEAYQAARARR